jgi:hypothetical protein
MPNAISVQQPLDKLVLLLLIELQLLELEELLLCDEALDWLLSELVLDRELWPELWPELACE